MKKHLLILTFSIALIAMPQAQPLTGITYSVGEGLPQSQVFAVTQDYKGYMWFGTQGGGLGAFDGKGFKHYGKQQGLPSDYILVLQEDKDKTLWVGIQGLILKQKNEEARDQMSSFAQLMRNILSNSRKQMITLKGEVETLEGYMLLEQHNQKTAFNYHITFAENIDKEELMLPPMLIQPFVENAILHGISRLE